MKVVLACGVFDLFHVAHLRHLQEASKMGDFLAVGVTKDDGVRKGNGRPVIPENERLEIIQGLDCVDTAILCKDSLEALDHFQPEVFCKGHDYLKKGLLPTELAFCNENHVDIGYTKENPQTTTDIIKRIRK